MDNVIFNFYPCGMCVLLKHNLVVTSRGNHDESVLHLYSLTNGSLLRTVSSDKSPFSYRVGGLCATPSGDGVLLAERDHSRVQEINVLEPSRTWVRFIGDGVLRVPEHVDCNAAIIAVAETSIHCVSLFTWTTGSPRARICPAGGPGALLRPSGVRLLRSGLQVAVADCLHHRICVFELDGKFLQHFDVTRDGRWPFDLFECDVDDGLIVASCWRDTVVKYDRRDGSVMPLHATKHSLYNVPVAAASLSDGGFVLYDLLGDAGPAIHVHVGLGYRLAWLALSCLNKSQAV